MDLLGVMEMFVERTWKVSTSKVNLRLCPRHLYLDIAVFGPHSFTITHDFYDNDLMLS